MKEVKAVTERPVLQSSNIILTPPLPRAKMPLEERPLTGTVSVWFSAHGAIFSHDVDDGFDRIGFPVPAGYQGSGLGLTEAEAAHAAANSAAV